MKSKAPKKVLIALALVLIFLATAIRNITPRVRNYTAPTYKGEEEKSILFGSGTEDLRLFLNGIEEEEKICPSQKWVRAQVMKSLMLRNVEYRAGTGNDYSNCSLSTLHRSFLFYESNVIFTGVPLNGCPKILKSLLIKEGKGGKQILVQSDALKLAFHEKEFSALSGMRTLTVIRNPWVRIVSGYLDKLFEDSAMLNKIKWKMVVHQRNLLGNEDLSFKQAKNHDMSPTFDEYLGFLLEEVGPYKPRDMILSHNVVLDNNNQFFAPQYKTLDFSNINYTYIACYEIINQQVDEMRNVLGLGPDFVLPDFTKNNLTEKTKDMFRYIHKDIVEELYTKFLPDFMIYNYSNFSDVNFPFPNCRTT